MTALTSASAPLPPALVRQLHSAGVTLYLSADGVLQYKPVGALPAELREAVRAVRDDLVRWLQWEALLCDRCCREILASQPVGSGSVWLHARLLHIDGCLPPGHVYNAKTGRVDEVGEGGDAIASPENGQHTRLDAQGGRDEERVADLIEFEAAPQATAALAR